jgi:hypothetical protein
MARSKGLLFMKTINLAVALLTPIILSACVIDARRADVVVGPDRTIDVPVTGNSVIDLRIPVGDVRIEGTSGDRLTAEMEVKCPDLESACAKRLGELQFITDYKNDRLVLRTNKNSSMKFRSGQVTTTVRIPEVRKVNVNMTAGDLNISDVQACLTVDMTAGDIDVDIAEELVASVMLDAGVGDASLRIDDRYRSAPRSWLIGAELAWDHGSGHCHVDVDLQAGDISVQLIN